MSVPIPKTRRAIGWIAALLIAAAAGIMIYSGVTKATDIPAFARLLNAQGLIPADAAIASAWSVTIAEIAVGAVGLYFATSSRQRPLGGLVVGAMFAALSIYATVLWLKPPAKPTGCGCAWSRRVVEDWGPLAARNWGCVAGMGFATVLVRRRSA